MTIKETSTEKHKLFTYSQFVDYAETSKPSKTSIDNKCDSSNAEASEWNGNMTLAKSIETARSGWDAGLKQLELENGVLADTGIIFEPNVCGSVVNMGNYLMGLPDNMFDLKAQREYNLPKLTVYVNMSYSGGNSAKKAMEFTKSIIEYVNKMQSTHNVQIIGVIYSDQNKVKYFVDVLIKDFDQRFVLNNVAFSFHVSFLRILYFKHIESEEFISVYGYGTPLDNSSVIQKIKKENLKNETVLLPHLNDLSDGSFTEKQITQIKTV